MSEGFYSRSMYNWADGLVNIVDAYEKLFDGAPAKVSRLYRALMSDAKGLREILADEVTGVSE